jgi:hypothetical protein
MLKCLIFGLGKFHRSQMYTESLCLWTPGKLWPLYWMCLLLEFHHLLKC